MKHIELQPTLLSLQNWLRSIFIFAFIWSLLCEAKSAFQETMLSLPWPSKLFVFTLPFGFAFFSTLHRSHNVCMQYSCAISWLNVVENPLCFLRRLLEVWLSDPELSALNNFWCFYDFIRAETLAVWHIFLDFPLVVVVLSNSHLPSDFPKN